MGQAPSAGPQQGVTRETPGNFPVTIPGAEGTRYEGDPAEIANVARADTEPWYKFWEGQNRSSLEQAIREELERLLP